MKSALEAHFGMTRLGLPYNRVGSGAKVAVVFQGLTFAHAPMRGLEARFGLSMYAFLTRAYTLVILGRRQGLREGTTPTDMIVTIEAEDRFDCRADLGRIQSPTLVAAGSDDAFYTPELFRATADGIPNGRLALYPNVGHPAQGKGFERDVMAFLSV
jgi:pimeloyl-ACP methyl ester carboxylesterase